MPILTLGRNTIAALAISTGAGSGIAKPYNSTNAYLIVGNSSAAHVVGSTWALGANSTMKGMDATYPIRTVNAIDFRATFSTAEANFAWKEWLTYNATSTGDANAAPLHRAVDETLGTKTSAQSWVFTGTVTFTT